MPTINVDGITFTFPNGWDVSKYDEWIYYRAYERARSGTKAVDLLVVDNAGIAWLIEVKDYRRHRRTKPTDLSHEIAQKVHDTLAVVLAAQTKAADAEEQRLARKVARSPHLRIVLHLEQPARHSKLFPRAIDPASVKLKLKTLVKQIDAHPVVVETSTMRQLSWTAA